MIIKARQLRIGDLFCVEGDMEEIVDLVVGTDQVVVTARNLTKVSPQMYLLECHDEVVIDHP